MVDNNPCLWRPGIRLGVKPGSWYHQTECFGPVLGLMRVENFEEALQIQNSSEFGLTGGLYSLDPQEIARWRESVEVGNAYVNRSTTGAIVRRQPFGGWKNSCVGPGPKAGGPNYVATFCHWNQDRLPTLRSEPSRTVHQSARSLGDLLGGDIAMDTLFAAGSYAYWWAKEFSISHDPSQVHGETNEFRYRPRPWHALRVQNPHEVASRLPTALALLACQTTGVRFELSAPEKLDWLSRLCEIAKVDYRVETVEQCTQWLSQHQGGTLRVLGVFDPQQFAPAIIGNIPIIAPTVTANGRLELLNYLKEQSMTQTVHRYGNII